MPRTQSLETISPRLDHIATVARQRPGEALTALAHHLDLAWLTWLNRRSQNARMHWTRVTRLLARFPLPSARVVHSIYRTAASRSC